MLSRAEAKVFYDRFGAKQDSQAWYEDPAINELLLHAGFDQADSICEFGCGTGRLAIRLFEEKLPVAARYFGWDLSATMVRLARERLSSLGDRASVELTQGDVTLPVPAQSFDRFVSTYVLDLLPADEIAASLAEAHRVLRAGGKLCLVGLTRGQQGCGRWVSAVWDRLHKLRPSLVGGCRPIELVRHLDPKQWAIQHRTIVTAYCVASEVLVAVPNPAIRLNA